ncbi:glycosyltransferase [Tibeticola sp.]|uniref:glycosyltransferase n=1 Tax=Tibeticola sp. TaxID=2005368 RepID=UPI0025EEC991|nr:glycosyltransferase [Tibeticola sp.]
MTDPMSRVIETRYGPAPTQPPLVSVLMITYNHEAFIREAIESVFAQVLDFPVELVIGEDFSTDSTRTLIQAVCADAPITVRLLTSDRNVGMNRNFARTFSACRGQYIALLEGDDYWLDPSKLAVQVSYLRANEDVALVAHRALRVFEKSVDSTVRSRWPHEVIPANEIGELSLSQIVGFRFMIPTASVLFKRRIIDPIDEWVYGLPFADIFISCKAAMVGKVVLLDFIGSVYRVGTHGETGRPGSNERFANGQTALLLRLLPSAADDQRDALLDGLQQNVYGRCDEVDRASGSRFEAIRLLSHLAITQLRFGRVPAGRTFRWLLRLLLKGSLGPRPPHATFQG